MAKRKGHAFANTAIISGTVLSGLAMLAFLFITGDTTIQQMIIEFRSEVFGVGVGILVIGVVAKLWRIRLG